MERLARLMMALIKSEMLESSLDEQTLTELTSAVMPRLYQLSNIHDVSHLVGLALEKNGLLANSEYEGHFRKKAVSAVARYEQSQYELDRITKCFNDAHIPFIPLKGSVLRGYYPVSWWRTSCDIDILIQKENMNKAADCMQTMLGYGKKTRGTHDVSLFAPNGVHIELHFELVEEGRVLDCKSILQTAWSYASRVDESSYCYAFDDAMFYFYHIAHMAKHFEIGGCGVRTVLDLWVLNHRVSFDADARRAFLHSGKLLAFAEQMELLSEVWFGDAEHTDITRRLERYVISGGTYGTTENRVSAQQNRNGGRFYYALSRIWLPYNVLKLQYPFLENKRYLLPWYELRRWLRLIFSGGLKRNLHELKVNSRISRHVCDDTEKLFFELGL